MITDTDIIKLKEAFVTKREFKDGLDHLEGKMDRRLTDAFDTLMEFLVAFRQDFEEFRSEMLDITGYQQRRIDKLEDKVYS